MGCIDTVLFDVDELQAGFTFFFLLFSPQVLEFDINITHWLSSSVDQRLERSQTG